MLTRFHYFKKSLNIECRGSLIPFKDMESNLQGLSQRLDVYNISQEVDYTLSKRTINACSKMFMNLNICYDFSFVKLYDKLSYGPSSIIGPLSLNIIKNSEPKFRPKALKIFNKMSQILRFQHIQAANDSILQFKRALKVKGKYIIIIIIRLSFFCILDQKLLQTVNNHPVHVLDRNGKFSPSAFIPFCSFGEDQLGLKIDQFDHRVCDIFTPVVLKDQLCYEANLDQLRDDQKFLTQLKMGLFLIIDYNEEKQFGIFVGENRQNRNDTKLKFTDDHAASIHMDTIGNKFHIHQC